MAQVNRLFSLARATTDVFFYTHVNEEENVFTHGIGLSFTQTFLMQKEEKCGSKRICCDFHSIFSLQNSKMKRGLAPCVQRTVVILVAFLCCVKVVHYFNNDGVELRQEEENVISSSNELSLDEGYSIQSKVESDEGYVDSKVETDKDLKVQEELPESESNHVATKTDQNEPSKDSKRDKNLKKMVNATVGLVDWLVESSDSQATKDKYDMVKSMLVLWNPEASRWARNASLVYREALRKEGRLCFTFQ